MEIYTQKYKKKSKQNKPNQREWDAQEREKKPRNRGKEKKKISCIFTCSRAPMLFPSDETSTAATDWCVIMPLPFLMSVDLVTIFLYFIKGEENFNATTRHKLIENESDDELDAFDGSLDTVNNSHLINFNFS